MLGSINLENFTGLTTMPQKAASAWTAAEYLNGAKYKPLLFVGTQIVKGTNYWFIAEQSFSITTPERRIVKLAVNEFDGKYTVVDGSIDVIFA